MKRPVQLIAFDMMSISLILRALADDRGAVVSIELVLVASVALLGLIVGGVSFRDAVVSEISDVAGSVQDANQSFSINGVVGGSYSVAGMSYGDQLDVNDDPGDVAGQADNCLLITVTPTSELGVTYTESFFGHATSPAASRIDSWNSNLVIDEEQTFTNTGSDEITVNATDFNFFAARTGGVVTPFIVKVNGDNDFEVVAVGDTVGVTTVGEQTHDFSAALTSVDVDAGDTLAFGFLDANPDGTGGNRSVIRFDFTTNEIWYSGGPRQGNSGSVSVGSAPTPGPRVLTNQRRDYQFRIGLDIPD